MVKINAICSGYSIITILIISMLGFDLRRASQLRRFSSEFLDVGNVGSGGFAEVRRVLGLLDNREYAAKVVRIKPSQNAQEAEERFFRLLAEPRAHAHLEHPNILRYHGCWLELEAFSQQERLEMQEEEAQNDPQFQMVVLGESMSSDGIVFGSGSSESPQTPLQQSHVRRQGRKIGDGGALTDYKQVRVYLLSELGEMDLSSFLHRRSKDRKERNLTSHQLMQVYRMALDMLAGLNYLHSKRIIHRDIKLHNIVLGKDGRCKLIDFGLAKRVKYWKTSIEHHTVMETEIDQQKFSSEIGTKLFSSPQQASSERYDFRTDIYSLAVVLVLLFHSYTTAHQQRELLEKVRKRNLQEMAIPQSLKLLLYKCLGGENERPSLSELKKCIKELMKELAHREEVKGRGDGSRCGLEEKHEEEVEGRNSMVTVKES